MRARSILVAVVTLTSMAAAVEGRAAALEQALTSGDLSSGDGFGRAVAVAGEVAAIGAPSDDLAGPPGPDGLPVHDQGSVRIFERSNGTWNEQAMLTASDREGGDLFGSAVALSADTALVGAIGDDSFAGSVYVFSRSAGNWIQQQELIAPDRVSGDSFGSAVALDGDTAIVGAFGTSGYAGAAYVFTRSEGGAWSLQQRLVQDPGPYPPSGSFGRAVAIDGDTAMIGADGALAAFPFTRIDGTWIQGYGLRASSNGSAASSPGHAVAVQGEFALIGDGAILGGTGSAMIWRQNPGAPEVWGPASELRVRGGTGTERFGISVALSEGTALVGAAGTDGLGAVYVFVSDAAMYEWTMVERLTTTADGWSDFGSSVAFSVDTVIAGAPSEDSAAGAAYVFSDTHPIAVADEYSTVEDMPLSVPAAGLLNNDHDADDTALRTHLIEQAVHGTATVGADGSLAYQPHGEYFGQDAITYATCDPWRRCTNAIATIFVAPVEDHPGARDDSFSSFEDSVLEVSAPGVLTNDTDADPGVLRAQPILAREPAHGAVEMREDGSFRYTPFAGFFGLDTFSYNVVDPTGRSDTAQVAITVNPVNDHPLAVDDVASTAQYAPVEIRVLDNDTDPESDALFVAWVSQPEHGTVSITPNNALVFSPGETFKDGDAFTYVVSDGLGASDPARVMISIDRCGEDGIDSLPGTVADGAVSGIIDRELEPLLYHVDPALAEQMHRTNCDIVVAAERAIEG